MPDVIFLTGENGLDDVKTGRVVARMSKIRYANHDPQTSNKIDVVVKASGDLDTRFDEVDYYTC